MSQTLEYYLASQLSPSSLSSLSHPPPLCPDPASLPFCHSSVCLESET